MAALSGGQWTSGLGRSPPPGRECLRHRDNDYQVRVAVSNSDSSGTSGEMIQSVPFPVTAPQMSSVALKANVASPGTVGSPIRCSAGRPGALPSVRTGGWVYNASVWSAATAWTTSSTWSRTPTVANGGYMVGVWCADLGTPPTPGGVRFRPVADQIGANAAMEMEVVLGFETDFQWIVSCAGIRNGSTYSL